MHSELQVFVIWHSARYKQKEILDDIKSKFDISQIWEVDWCHKFFIKNLSNFYGKKLLKARKKAKQVGRKQFLVIAVKDNNPIYQNGKNLNMVKAKNLYREQTGGGHLVHASDSEIEAKENLEYILGFSENDFIKLSAQTWNGKIINSQYDPEAMENSKEKMLFENFINKISSLFMLEFNKK